MIPDQKSKAANEYQKYLDNKGDLFIWKPESTIMKIWQGILIFLLLYTATLMPYKIALIDDSDSIELFYIDTVIDFLFVFDMYVNFNTPILIKTDIYNNNRREIANNYLKTWFIIDLLASLPMNLF